MADRAHQLFKRVLEADALIQALPPLDRPPHDLPSQLEQVLWLEAQNERVTADLAAAQQEAKLWQQRVSHVLQQAAACQLRTSIQQNADHEHIISSSAVGDGDAEANRAL